MFMVWINVCTKWEIIEFPVYGGLLKFHLDCWDPRKPIGMVIRLFCLSGQNMLVHIIFQICKLDLRAPKRLS